tara:strand:+ start:170 stop:571 length:402 start_codon:yes stop_codon:yes gene_type:complete
MDIENARKEVVAGWGETPAAALSMRILDYISCTNRRELQMLTFRQICHAARVDSINEDLLSALAILTSDRVEALTTRAMFVDFDETEYELDADTFRDIQSSGEFVHPETGDLVEEFQSRIFPFFVPSVELVLD